MQKLTRALLFCYVATLTWDNVPVPLIGSVSRLTGLAFVGSAIVTMLLSGSFRRPDAIVMFSIAFSLWSALSLVWTVSYSETSAITATYVQLAVSVWLIREFIRDWKQVESVMVAFCFGSFVPLVGLLRNYWMGVGTADSGRYTATNLNPNILGLMLVLALPMAWYLFMHRRGLVRKVALIFLLLVPLSVLLTGTRGGFVAGIVALSIVPLTLPLSAKWYASAITVLAIGIASSIYFAPPENWRRMGTISSELTDGGRMSGRSDIWSAGLELIPERPFLGYGAGAFITAVEAPLGRRIPSHNTALAIVIEQGAIGFVLFLAILLGCTFTILRLPAKYRAVWAVVLCTWLVGSMDANFEYSKATWLMFAALSAQGALAVHTARANIRAAGQERARPMRARVPSTPLAQRSLR